MSGLYDSDILEWSERQAALLRRVAAGERVDSAGLDWPNIIDEVESVGREQLHAAQSLLIQGMAHWLKPLGWPESAAASGWRKEVRVFAMQARRRFVPSMRQYLDLADLHDEALLSLPNEIDGRPPLPLPDSCPFALDGLLSA